MRNIPRAGEFYKHFKGNLYQIVAIAKDADSMESRVIYQALYGTFQIYDRTLADFMSKVDTEKYPEAEQEYRFEQVELEEESECRSIIPVKTTISKLHDDVEIPVISMEKYPEIENQRKELEAEPRIHLENHVKGAIESHADGVDQRLLEFLDADTYTRKLELFNHMRENITERILTDIAMSLDTSLANGSLEEKFESLRRDLETLARFERNNE